MVDHPKPVRRDRTKKTAIGKQAIVHSYFIPRQVDGAKRLSSASIESKTSHSNFPLIVRLDIKPGPERRRNNSGANSGSLQGNGTAYGYRTRPCCGTLGNENRVTIVSRVYRILDIGRGWGCGGICGGVYSKCNGKKGN
jgi:hypothetical protein